MPTSWKTSLLGLFWKNWQPFYLFYSALCVDRNHMLLRETPEVEYYYEHTPRSSISSQNIQSKWIFYLHIVFWLYTFIMKTN